MDKMPFGRHRGRRLSDLPDQYLSWLLGLPSLRSPLREALQAEAARRRLGGGPIRAGDRPPDPALAAEVVTTGYRALARRLHPDVGGGTRAMQALNATVAWLRDHVGVA